MLGGTLLRLTTLGAIDVRDGRGHPVRDVLAQPKRVALLVYMAVEGRKGVVARDRLLAMFWPESDAAHARNTLSQALHHLRTALGTDVIEGHGAAAIGVQGDRLWCDATQFTAALERGDVELALDLYRGEFCPTLYASDAPEFEQWLDAERRRLRTAALAAARSVAERLAAAGAAAGAARAARRALAMHPDDEADVRALLALLERCGDVAGALLAYQEFERRLAAELETEPAPQTRQLVDAIRRRREVAAAESGAEGAPPVAYAPPALGPIHARRPSAARGRRPPIIAAILVALIAGAIALTDQGPRAAGPPVKAIAVFPFAVRGGPGLGYLREGMVDLLSAKLDGAGGFRAIDPRSVFAEMANRPDTALGPADYARMAQRLGAGWFVTGDAARAGDRLQLNGALHDLSGRAQGIATASVSGDTAALFHLVDDLTGRVLAGLVTGRDTAITRLAAVTTHSLPALKAFLDGERALRTGLDAQAAAAFLEAAAIDTTFALAQYRLAVSATWIAVPAALDPTAWASRAARHAQRLTPLTREILTAYQAYRQTRADEAEAGFRDIIRGHPENFEAWFMLGEALFHFNPHRGRPPGESRAAFERVLALDPDNGHALLHLARLAASEGRAAWLDSLAGRYFDTQPAADRAIEMQALLAYSRDDAAGRAAVAAAAHQSDAYVWTGLLLAGLVYAQNLGAADDFAPSLPPPSADLIHGYGRRALSDIDAAGGRSDRATGTRLLGIALDHDWLTETEALLAAEPLFAAPRARVAALRDSIARRQPYPMLVHQPVPADSSVVAEMRVYLLGLLSVRLGDERAARDYAAQLDAVRDARRGAVARDLARGVRAEIARTAGDLRRALAELEPFAFEPSHQGTRGAAHWGVRERFFRGELLFALGRIEEALPWYDSFVLAYDLPFIAAAHLRRGEIHERLGNTERAAFHYVRFIALWRDSDPELRPLVARARLALASLEAR